MANPALESREPNSVSDLDSLRKQINAAHVEVLAVLLTSVQWAAEAGHLLAQAKELVSYGQWEIWVTENTAISPRTARGYMQAARFWEDATKAKRRALADLGLQGLLAKIAEPRCTPAAPTEPKIIKLRVIEELPKTTAVQVVHVSGEDSEHIDSSDRRCSENLDAAKQAYLRLNKADQQEFRNWTAEGASAPVKIIDAVAT